MNCVSASLPQKSRPSIGAIVIPFLVFCLMALMAFGTSHATRAPSSLCAVRPVMHHACKNMERGNPYLEDAISRRSIEIRS
ncbi:hypothetical protein B0H19DRAFT_1153294 [Mycena capillaripes]|nr:hypothetical protein B0H19DRAFT_1153294 [Mycena capillaripes]